MLEYLKAWFITKVARDEKGQDAAEYALLIGLIALAIVIAVTALGTNLAAVFQSIATAVSGFLGGGGGGGGGGG